MRLRVVGGIGKVLHRRLQHGFVSRLSGFGRPLLDRRAIGRKPERDRAGQVGDRAPGSLGVEAEAADHQRDPRTAGPGLRIGRDRPLIDLERTRAVGADARQEAIARLLDQARVGRRLEPDRKRARHVDDERIGRAAAAHARDPDAARRLHLIGRGDRGRRGFMDACGRLGRRGLGRRRRRRDFDLRHRKRLAAEGRTDPRERNEADRRRKSRGARDRASGSPPLARGRRSSAAANKPERFVHFIPHCRPRPLHAWVEAPNQHRAELYSLMAARTFRAGASTD